MCHKDWQVRGSLKWLPINNSLNHQFIGVGEIVKKLAEKLFLKSCQKE